MNGLAAHSELGKEHFIAALYTDSLSTTPNTLLSANEQKRMELRITTKRLSSRRLNSLWIEGMAINVPGSLLTKHAENMVKFAAMFRGKLAAGDNLSIAVAPGEGTSVTLNGVELGHIHADGFFELLLRTWIGSVPLSSDFREQILKAGDVDPALLARYEALSPDAERIAAINAWTQPSPNTKPKKPTSQVAATALPQVTPPRLVPAPSLSAPRAVEAPAATPAPPVANPAATPTATNVTQSQPELAAAADTDVTPAESAPSETAEQDEEVPQLTAETLLNRQLYHSKLLKWTYKYLSYPRRALKRGQQGSVRLTVVIDREGNVQEVTAVEESRFALLNREALGAVKRAEPFPPVPDTVSGERFEFSLPIVFRLPK